MARIWKELQKLGGPEAEIPATDTPAAEPKAARKAKAPKPAKEAKAPAPKAAGAAGTSKKATILALISRKNGATLEEIMKATAWQKHSVRGAIATMGKTTKIESSKSESGARTYKVK